MHARYDFEDPDFHVGPAEPIPPRTPERPLGALDPLITAAACYPALERAALRAKHSIWFWFRVFDPAMVLVSDEARATGARNWAELLAQRGAAGIDIAVAMSDFDPIGATPLHEAAHRNAENFKPVLEQGNARLLIAGHDARAAWLWRCLTWPGVMMRVERQRRRLATSADPQTALARLPGLARWLRFRDERIIWTGWRLPALMPATHHQKIAVFDGTHAVIGGLDVDQRRYDAPDHDRPAPQTWRDVSVAVDGPVVGDIASHIAACWNHEARRAGAQAPRPLKGPLKVEHEAAQGAASIQLSRTVSRQGARSWLRIAPRPRVRELEADHLALIDSARTLLYVETQFLRSSRIVAALARAADERPELGLITVLPAAPEDVAFDDAKGIGPRYGEFLQARAVRRLRRHFGDRAVFLSPVRPKAADAQDRSTHAQADIVYVHSKVSIADGHTAIISSANLNGRSLRWDTEAGVLIRGADSVERLRRAMFETLLPEDAPAEALALSSAVSTWRRIAQSNLKRHPSGRRGFLLPYPEREAEEFGREIPALPEEMV